LNQVIGYFKLFRGLNLLFIVLTMCLVRYFLVLHNLDNLGLEYTPALNTFEFCLLIIATVLVASAGYVINDYFDVNIDYVNKPTHVTIGTLISRRHAMILHLVFNAIAAIIGIGLGWKIGFYNLGFIFVVASGLLWFYSTIFKKKPVIGNLIVSLLTAIVVLIVPLYETNLRELVFRDIAQSIMLLVAGYMFFAFLISWIREIVKDLEDMDGDIDFDCNTLPILIGVKWTKYVTILLIIVHLVFLVGIQLYYQQQGLTQRIIYIAATLELPLLFTVWALLRAQSNKDYHFISNVIKGIMLTGILSMAFFIYLH